MNSSFRKRMRALFATNILALSALVCSFPTLIAPAVADESLFLPVCAEQGESLLTVQRAASNPYDDKPRDNRAWQVEVRQVSTDTDLIRGKNQDPTYWQNWLRKQNNT
ncbi:hypothetical protein [Arcanobacterium hippocoleae]|uniref:hypothetical protein n=1 Tax=Arcanobacterium hippocoleae TaxID=149017 RepID=UPI00333F4FB0